MKILKKFLLSLAVIGSLAALSFLYISRSLQEKTVRTAFYGLTDVVRISLGQYLDDCDIAWKEFVLDPKNPLQSYIKKSPQYDLLFVCDGENLDSIGMRVRNPETEALLMLPPSIRVSVHTANRLTGTPVLADQFQLFYNPAALAALNTSEPLSLFSLEDAAKKALHAKNQGHPILCAGNDDNHLIMFFSALLEASQGIEVWEKARIELQKSPDKDFVSFFALTQLRSTLEILRRWQQEGVLPQTWLKTSADEAAEKLYAEAPALVFAPLSFWRSINVQTANKYTLHHMPPGKLGEKRYMTASLVAAIQFSVPKSPFQTAAQANTKLAAVRSLVRELVSSPAQGRLSKATGLIPVNASAEADKGANEGRLQLSLSSGIIPDIAQAALLTSTEREAFAQKLRTSIER